MERAKLTLTRFDCGLRNEMDKFRHKNAYHWPELCMPRYKFVEFAVKYLLASIKKYGITKVLAEFDLCV